MFLLTNIKYKIKFIIVFISLYFNINIKTKLFINKYNNNISINHIDKNDNFNKINISELINKLNSDIQFRVPKYILLFDFFYNKYCTDLNSYIIFQYYLHHNKTEAYYIINNESNLYNSLLKNNKTQNIIPINPIENYWNKLYYFILNSKIIVQSYFLIDFIKIINQVSYLKYLKINHGIRYFKRFLGKYEFNSINITKYNTIISSPYEYNIFKKYFKLKTKNVYKAGLPRYDRFKKIKKNKYERKCILIAFTYRSYNNEVYENSLFKKNLEKLLSNTNLINFLKTKNIDLIYIPHHYDTLRNRTFNFKNFPYIQYKKQENLEYYIGQCSLCITDFSSVSFDFMFQNKPVLFYFIDKNDKKEFFEKKCMKYGLNEKIYFGNAFNKQKNLIEKIKYFINNNFKIGRNLKKKYDSIFYYRYNITERIVNIIEDIIQK